MSRSSNPFHQTDTVCMSKMCTFACKNEANLAQTIRMQHHVSTFHKKPTILLVQEGAMCVPLLKLRITSQRHVGSRNTAPRVLNLGARWCWCCRWTWRQRRIPCLHRESNSDHPNSSHYFKEYPVLYIPSNYATRGNMFLWKHLICLGDLWRSPLVASANVLFWNGRFMDNF